MKTAPKIWLTSSDRRLKARATQVIEEVKRRLRDPAQVRELAKAMEHQSRYPSYQRWIPMSTCLGDVGMAVMCSHLANCFPNEDWVDVGHQYMRSATASPIPRSTSIGLLSGLSGLGTAALLLAGDSNRYGRLLASVDDVVACRVLEVSAEIKVRACRCAAGDFGVAAREVDIVSGLSGAAIYLSKRAPNSSLCREALVEAIEALVSITSEPDHLRWKTPSSLLDEPADLEVFPIGKLNMGFAHGLPGLLVGMLSGIGVVDESRVLDSVTKASAWLMGHREDDDWGYNWPTAYRIEPAGATRLLTSPFGPSRSAWCYGVPGVAAALCTVALAADDIRLLDASIAAITSVRQRPHAIRRAGSPTLCHGMAGILQIVLRINNISANDELASFGDELLEQVISRFEVNSLFGYRHEESSGVFVDNPGFLDGAAGVLLALCSATFEVEPKWDMVLGMSGHRDA
jgi:lantibiotic biosynthesis protein